MSPRLFRSSLPLFVASFLLAPATARAGDPAAAQQLFDDAKQLAGQGRYSEACPKLEESQRLDPGLGTQFHLADCMQHVGRTATAWTMFRDVESAAHGMRQTSRERVAHDRAAALEPFLPRMRIDPNAAASTPGLQIRRDGVEVNRDSWSVPMPVDPGSHVVAVTAPGKQPWETAVQVATPGKIVTVDVPLLADAAPPVALVPPPAYVAVPPPPRVGVTQSMPPSTETAVLVNRGGVQRAVGWFFVGAGVVGLGAGGYFGVKWLDDRNNASPHCSPGGVCDSVGSSLRDDQNTQSRNGEAAAGVGAAALLVGTILVVSAPGPRVVMQARTAPSKPSVQVTPMVGLSQGGLAVHGAW